MKSQLYQLFHRVLLACVLFISLVIIVSAQPQAWQLQLKGGNETAGLVEIYINERWGTICNSSWDLSEATVACRQLGFAGAYGTIGPTRSEDEASLVQLHHVSCTGIEDSLRDCYYILLPECNHGVESGVSCYNYTQRDVRMVKGNFSTGLVEVLLDDNWRSVCATSWNYTAAEYLCYQLGFPGALLAEAKTISDGMADGNYPSDVECFENEFSTINCSFTIIQSQVCEEDLYASVACNTTGITPYRDDYRCGSGWVAPNGEISKCNINSESPCCSTHHWCGASSAHCDCTGCNDQRVDEPSDSSGEDESASYYIHRDEASFISYDIYGDYPFPRTHGNLMSTEGYEGGQLRLVGGNVPYAGRIEIFRYGQWHTICSSSWYGSSIITGTVVCRQLGFGDAISTTSSDFFGPGNGSTLIVSCRGIESSLHDCLYRFNTHYCSSNDATGVACAPLEVNEGTVTLIEQASMQHPETIGAFSGVVYVFYDGKWHSVYPDQWDTSNAYVVCRQLGYTGVISYSFYEKRLMSPTIDVKCNGNEKSIIDCSINVRPETHVHMTYMLKTVGVTCASADEGQLRLAGGADIYSGRVEIFLLGSWWSICDNEWDIEDANVVCNQLGYGDALLFTTKSMMFGANDSLSFILYGLNCDGSEPYLTSCHRVNEISTCDKRQVAGVVCEKSTFAKENQFEIKLLDGYGNKYAGRVEISFRGQTGTICDNEWDIHDANVVCTQLGYGPALRSIAGSLSGKGIGDVLVTEVQCTGREKTLSDCRFGIGSPGIECINHDKDAGVECSEVSEFPVLSVALLVSASIILLFMTLWWFRIPLRRRLRSIPVTTSVSYKKVQKLDTVIVNAESTTYKQSE